MVNQWVVQFRWLFKKSRGGIAAVLTIELLLAQLANAIPELHDWLHGESVCGHYENAEAPLKDSSEATEEKDHVCLIQLLNEGVVNEVRSDFERPGSVTTAIPESVYWFASYSKLAKHSARGPPVFFR